MASTLNVITAAAFAFVTLVPSQRGAGTGLPGVSGADVLTGRVSDADGHPVPGAFVSALFPAASGRRFSSQPKEFATLTGQLGEFRLEGLGSREFYVVAIPRGFVPPTVDGLGSAITYYPSALTTDESKVLRLTPSRLTHLDIVLRSARLSAVSGRVLTSNGELVRGGKLALDHLDGLYGFDSRAVDIRSDGTFGIPSLPPGSYFLQYREAGSPTGPLLDWKVSRAKVRVTDRDVTDVQVVPVTMVRVTGRIMTSPEDRSALDPSRVKIWALPIDSDDNPGPQVIGNVRPDWSFQLYTWPGIGRVRVEIRTIDPPPLKVAAVRLNGVDVMNKDITFTQDQHLAGLEVELIRR
jgi:hypothetical protein